MIVLDTCTLIFDALAPDKLSSKALRAVENGEKQGMLACSDISLWEISMLTKKGRLDPGTDTISFINLVLSVRKIKVVPITPEIACISSSHKAFVHHDPADRPLFTTKGLLLLVTACCAISRGFRRYGDPSSKSPHI